MPDTATVVIVVTLTFLLAGLVKGVIGMGLPTVAMGLLALVMPPVQAAALLVVPSLITNIWQWVAGPGGVAACKRFATMMIAVVVGTFTTVGLLANTGGAGANVATFALGAVLALYGAVSLRAPRWRMPPRHEPLLSPLIGLVTGLITGATGIFVIPAVPYFNALGLEKEPLIQALGLSFTVSTLALAAGLLMHGKFELNIAGTSLLALLPALGGMLLGQRLRERLKPEVFRRWFFVGLIVLGSYMVARALAHGQ